LIPTLTYFHIGKLVQKVKYSTKAQKSHQFKYKLIGNNITQRPYIKPTLKNPKCVKKQKIANSNQTPILEAKELPQEEPPTSFTLTPLDSSTIKKTFKFLNSGIFPSHPKLLRIYVVYILNEIFI
jgi:hypothetical protein